MVGVFTGPLVDTGHLRPLMISGNFLIVFGMMMTSLATEYYQVSIAKHPFTFFLISSDLYILTQRD